MNDLEKPQDYFFSVSGNGAAFNAILIACFRDIKLISKQKCLFVLFESASTCAVTLTNKSNRHKRKGNLNKRSNKTR